MQYKVPQNIDKEDQIVGPLTLIEFSYLAIGGALDILINQTIKGPLGFLLIGIVSLVALAFTFLKIQDRPLLFFISAMIQYATQPKTRVWHKLSDRPILQLTKHSPKKTIATSQRKSFDSERVQRATEAVDFRGKKPTTEAFKNVETATLIDESIKPTIDVQ